MKFVLLGCLVALTWLNAEARNPMWNPGMYQGDMLGVELDENRNAIPRDSQRWPHGVIPYIIDGSLPQSQRRVLLNAMKHIEAKTCITFVRRTVEKDYVRAIFGEGCYAHWGRLGIGEQKLSLGDGCANLGTGIHEWMHAIGFEHEHNRSDRDGYINVLWENVPDDWVGAFKKLKPSQNRLLTSFDFESITLYGSGGFDAYDPSKLSMVKKNGDTILEVWDKNKLSATDIKRISMLYNC